MIQIAAGYTHCLALADVGRRVHVIADEQSTISSRKKTVTSSIV
jgi:anaerobic glycerol-3-phosphate dehydrogenase